MNSQVKRYIRQGLEGYQLQKLLSPWSWGIRHITIYSHGSMIKQEGGAKQENSGRL